MSRWGAPKRGLRAIAGAITVVYAFRSFAAWVLAQPALQAVAQSGVLNFPEGDALLFEPGASYLLEFLSSQRSGLTAAFSWYWMAWLTLAFAGLWPQWLTFRACALEADSPRRAAPSWPEWLAFAGMGVSAWLARGALLVVTVVAALALRAGLMRVEDERVADLSALAVVALGLLAQGGCSVGHDVCRAVLVRQGVGVRVAVAGARSLLRQRGWALGVRYLATLLGSALVIAGGALLVGAVDAARAAPWGAAFVFASHQVVVLATLVSRAIWIDIAVREATAFEHRRGVRRDPGHAEAFL